MNIAVFGLGYVGCVTAACLARDGHHVIGVDVNCEKVERIRQGESPVIEPGLPRLIQDGVKSGKIEATGDATYAIRQADLAIICVGTPSKQDGNLELKYVERVCRDIGQALRLKNSYTVIVVRSTILPGVASEHLVPLLEQEAGKKAGFEFGFCVNPEFLREGTAIVDFDTPPYTVIGQLDEKSGDQAAQLYANIDAPVHRVSLGAAEMIKYAGNAFHALKVVFANEIGNLCQQHAVDSHEVMDVFVQDTKLNISSAYLKPGFSFGGSCLGKDLRALLYEARQHSLRLPVLESVLPSNQLQVEKVLNILLNNGRHSVGLIGLSFKSDTDDLRESPAVELAERLIGKGFDLHIYDREVSLGHLHGSNRSFIAQAIPHLSSLIRPTLEETVQASHSVVITKRLSNEEFVILSRLLRSDQSLIDLVRLNGRIMPDFEGTYYGICW
jgi:GDP-mannose 6-dehydrogenase